jgi:hypothetical protein
MVSTPEHRPKLLNYKNKLHCRRRHEIHIATNLFASFGKLKNDKPPQIVRLLLKLIAAQTTPAILQASANNSARLRALVNYPQCTTP